MILEAFSKTLQRNYGTLPTEEILHCWLLGILAGETDDGDEAVCQVILSEIALIEVGGRPWFEGRTFTGKKLLKSLYNYCKSYDHWQFCRWLHEIKASDFSLPAS